MGLNINTSVSFLTVFIQGLLSFFSPCVLPILPLYIAYFSGGASKTDSHGNIIYPKKKIFLNTIFFVLGISITFFILGFSFTAFGKFFTTNKAGFSLISGIIMIIFGLYQFGLFKRGGFIEKERKLNIDVSKFKLGSLSAFLLGFTFSFSWTPCIGPIMSSVLLMASSSDTSLRACLLISIYVIGFTLPFILTGLFTGAILNFFKKYKNIVKYTVKIGAILLIIMGIITLSAPLNNYIKIFTISNNKAIENKSNKDSIQKESNKNSENKKSTTPAIDFKLVDQNGKTHMLSDYKGKTILLNFWATWCPPCRAEMPDIQALYEKYEQNTKDVIILGVAMPNIGNEKSKEEISNFLNENSYTYPTLMDEKGTLSTQYGISAYPTTFMIDSKGNIFGYITGALDTRAIENIINQTINSTK